MKQAVAYFNEQVQHYLLEVEDNGKITDKERNKENREGGKNNKGRIKL
jgi:hypothetical protein